MDRNIFGKKINLNTYQTIALSFILIILAGSILLSLPFASKSGTSCGYLTALFTATSSVCVTGLSVVDVWSTFSFFGQAVLIILVQVGGLGFMTIVTIIYHLAHHKENAQEVSLSADSLGLSNLKDFRRIQKRLVIGSFIFECLGAIALFIFFLPSMGVLNALWFGIFHSVSSFCNAGFDLMGYFTPGIGFVAFNTNPGVLITLSVLIVVGGLGFIVWDDIAVSKSPRNWSVYTRMVLLMTSILLVFGTLFFLGAEYNNDVTIGNMNIGNKILNSLFQSVTTRTAGFASLDQGSMLHSSNALTCILMMIGGSAGSTAGGIKTVTFLILLKALFSNLQGKKNVVLFHRTITPAQILYAFTVTGGFVFISIFGGFFISFTSGISFIPAIFESVSALATVGLSLGITSSLSVASKLMVILLMFVGRVGLVTLTFGFFKAKENQAIKYPTTNIMIG